MDTETRETLNAIWGTLQAILRQTKDAGDTLSALNTDADLSDVIEYLYTGDINGASVAISNLLAEE